MAAYVISFVGVLVPLVSISILMVLQITEIFRSILKGRGMIHSSNCNTFHVGLKYEKCLDIDSFRARSRAKDCWLVQTIGVCLACRIRHDRIR